MLMLTYLTGYSQVVHNKKRVTIGWDEVTTIDGEPLEGDEIISYNVYLRPEGTTGTIVIQEILGTQFTMSYSRGLYVVGVSSLVEYPDGEKYENFDITWSISEDVERVLIPFLWNSRGISDAVKGLEVLE
jgi:hypothetical protein